LDIARQRRAMQCALVVLRGSSTNKTACPFEGGQRIVGSS
jgi:hypothetical protein